MRILYLADIRFPLEQGHALQTFETCRAVAARGHAVTLLVCADTTWPGRDPWLFYGTPREPGLTIARVPPLPGLLGRGAFVTVALARAVSVSPDVVVTRDLRLADRLLGLPKGLRSPLVYESHRYAPAAAVGGPAPTPWPTLEQATRRESRVWRAAAGYITLTRIHQQELEDRFGVRPNAAVIPNGVRLDPARAWSPAPPLPFTIAYAGRLDPPKGVDVLLRALAELPHVQARIIGGQTGDVDHVRLDGLARDLGVSDRVAFTGWVQPTSVATELARAHALILPSTLTHTGERYASPLKLFEYLAAGRPIVASDLAAVREILRHDDNALLVEPGSPPALAAAVRRLMDDRTLGVGLAQRAFAGAAEYGWDTRAERIDAVLDAARAHA